MTIRKHITTALWILMTLIILSDTAIAGPLNLNPSIIYNPIRSIVCMFVRVVILVAAAIAAVVFVVAGTRWVISRDDAAKRKQAKESMIHAIIGLVIIGIADNLVEGVRSATLTFAPCTV